ncbi:outer membrane protein [Methylocystis parvus]|uniref:Porin family protein n=1 Tax=Methylocystis parvus TaxID=134 RepID=A0A6B8MAA9_9HYPH|nr:outer membrane beta-barrel protein [Methylocystis parvus]QGM97590.1 porin family protein [Methylocystis parvus]WBJ98478.1 outer membrane beta-barrel protein [Methylocystis parvus OBBP]
MKKLALIAAASFAAGSAFAADLPSRKEAPVYVPPPPLITWTGFYAGVNIGGGWSANSVNPNSLAPYANNVTGAIAFLPGNSSGGNTAGGVVGGGQIGYNYQMGAFLVGLETDFQGSSMNSGGSNNYAVYPGGGAFLGPVGSTWVPLTSGGNNGVSLSWIGTVRGRAGYLITPTLLAYATGGFAYGGLSANANGYSNTRTGWTVGGGAEWLFMPNWSAKVEYLYTDLSGSGSTGAWGWNWGYNRHPNFHIVRAGVNYHFNWGAAAPVVAKY